MKTTLNKIRKCHPCGIKPGSNGELSGFMKLMHYLGKTQVDDEPVSILQILDSNGIDDAIWCLRAVDGYDKEIRLFAVWCARQVEHLMTDQRSKDALDTAERFANGAATSIELKAARTAAGAATGTAAGTAAWAAAGAAARTAAWTAAWAAAGAVQAEKLHRLCAEIDNRSNQD